MSLDAALQAREVGMKRQRGLANIGATIIISLAVTSRASGGDFWGGNDLYAKCTSSAEEDQALCVGYVMGISDAGAHEAIAHSVFQGATEHPLKGGTLGGFRWCPPKTVTAGQMVDVVVKFLRDNAANRDRAAASGEVVEAMQQAWPCSP